MTALFTATICPSPRFRLSEVSRRCVASPYKTPKFAFGLFHPAGDTGSVYRNSHCLTLGQKLLSTLSVQKHVPMKAKDKYLLFLPFLSILNIILHFTLWLWLFRTRLFICYNGGRGSVTYSNRPGIRLCLCLINKRLGKFLVN